MGENYIPEAGGEGVRYNDPQFGFEWPMEPSVISQKDRNIPDFDPKFLK
jgi:dTDP-4-dehydrorhamnose 3,5-epimerase